MIYTDKTKRAMDIAYKAHEGQFDKSNTPYIYHPLHVAEQMNTENEVIVALLHDVVEDTEVTIEDLSKEFDKEIIDAIKLLTKNGTNDYLDYVSKIKQNPLATKVKIEDIKHNLDKTRLKEITDVDIARIEKYQKALDILLK